MGIGFLRVGTLWNPYTMRKSRKGLGRTAEARVQGQAMELKVDEPGFRIFRWVFESRWT